MKRIAALLLAAACGGSRPDAAAGPSADSLILERRIASDESGDHPFSYIGRVVLAGDRVYLTQWGERSVLAFDTAGRFLRRIGRDGAAPGEFRIISWVGVIGDTLWVIDYAQDRLTAFDSVGVLLAVQTAPVQVPGWPRKGFHLGLTQTGVLAEGAASVDALYSGAVPSIVPLVIAGRDGTTRRIVDRLDRSRLAFGVAGPDGAGLLGYQPFADSPVIVADGRGRGFGVIRREVADAGPTAAIVLYNTMAETLYARGLRPRPEPLTDPVFDSAASEVLRNAPRDDPSVLYRPTFLPAAGQAHFANDGALWIQLGRGEVQEWAVLEPNGECRARLTLRFPGRLEAADGWRIWVVETDSLDVPSVVRYRVVPRVPADTGC